MYIRKREWLNCNIYGYSYNSKKLLLEGLLYDTFSGICISICITLFIPFHSTTILLSIFRIYNELILRYHVFYQIIHKNKFHFQIPDYHILF